LKRFWHQNTTLGAKPAGYNYGSEFSIPSELKAIRDDDGTHGTHVAGIMAGSGFTTPQLSYRGMAPESDLVFVTIRYTNDSLQGSAYGDYIVANPTILDGYKYIFDYAKTVNKPAVINLSWGMHTGPHDGTSIFDLAVDQLTGSGKILVGANGNDAGNQMHVIGTLNRDTAYTFAVDRNRKDYPKENIYCDFWGPVNENLGLNISVFDTLGNQIHTEPFVYAATGNWLRKTVSVGSNDTLAYTMACQKKYANNGKSNILLMAEMSNSARYRLRIGITTKGTFHGWNSGQTYRWTSGSFLDEVKGNSMKGKYLAGTAAGSMSENGGTGKRTISTGSYINRKEWIDYKGVYRSQNWLTVGEISGFSGRGPTPDGRMKPDISAPGQLVASAVNNKQFAGWMGDYTPYTSQFNGETQYWTMFSGTSMASPHAAGIIALMLEACPTLSPEQIKFILSKTSTRDALTGSDSNNSYGYGRINAFEAIKASLSVQHSRSANIHFESNLLVFPVPASKTLVLSNPVLKLRAGDIFIYDAGGRLLRTANLRFDSQGECSLAVDKMATGVYTFKVQGNDLMTQGKFVVEN
jgi:subtilisin family serine protease